MQWENVYIFISSTFNDMHAERDYLVKSVFPELSEWCEARKLRLIDIDLRWGVSEADATQNKRVVQVCLDRIDECRPFFLCFLGQRRGWVPNKTDVSKETRKRFPGLRKQKRLGKNSVTEMEIIHALIDPLHKGSFFDREGARHDGSAADHAFFFLRDPGYLKELDDDLLRIYTNKLESNPKAADQALTHWRETAIPQTGRPVRHYSSSWIHQESTPEIALPLVVPTTASANSKEWANAFGAWRKQWAAVGVAVDSTGIITDDELEKAREYNKRLTAGRLGDFQCGGAPLADIIIEELKSAIAIRYPGHMTVDAQTKLQKELDQQAQFLRIAGEGFIKRHGDFDALNEYISGSDNRPFAVTAHAGMGKTSFLAHWINKYRPQSGESLYYRFIGASDDSVSVDSLIRSLLSELRETGKIKSVIPSNSNEMLNNLPEYLSEAGQSGRVIIVLDAINQLESGMDDLHWIPGGLPENVKLVVSFKRGDEKSDEYYDQQGKKGGMILHDVKPFISLDDRKAIVTAYLEQYFKELDEPRIQMLINSEGAENPLFVKTALSELRVFGAHNDLSEIIRTRFGNTPVSAFQAILERMENDPSYTQLDPKESLPRVFGWIAHSRNGVSVDELANMLTLENLSVSRSEAKDAVNLILRQLRPFLAKREGRVDFFYESFKIATIERYTSNNHEYARSSMEWHRSLAKYFETLPLETPHRLMEQAWQYAYAGMGNELNDLLWQYAYLNARLKYADINALIADFGLLDLPHLSDDDMEGVNILRECISLSAHVLVVSKNQLAEQLWGRMAGVNNSRIQIFLRSAVKYREENGEAWLRPSYTCMTPPGTRLRYSLTAADDPHTSTGVVYNLKYRNELVVSISTVFVDGTRLVAINPDTRRVRKIVTVGRTMRTCFSPDEEIIAVCGGPGHNQISFLSLTTGAVVAHMKVLSGPQPSMVFLSNEELLVTGYGGELFVWSLSKDKVIRSLKSEMDVTKIYFNEPDRRLYIVTREYVYENDCYIYKTKKYDEHLESMLGEYDGSALSFSEDGRTCLFLTSDQKTLTLYDLVENNAILSINEDNTIIRAVIRDSIVFYQISHDTQEQLTKAYDTINRRTVFETYDIRGPFIVANDGSLAAGSRYSGAVSVYETSVDDYINDVEQVFYGHVALNEVISSPYNSYAAFSADNKTALLSISFRSMSNADKRFIFFSVDDGKVIESVAAERDSLIDQNLFEAMDVPPDKECVSSAFTKMLEQMESSEIVSNIDDEEKMPPLSSHPYQGEKFHSFWLGTSKRFFAAYSHNSAIVKFYSAIDSNKVAELYVEGGVAVANSSKSGKNVMIVTQNGHVLFLTAENFEIS